LSSRPRRISAPKAFFFSPPRTKVSSTSHHTLFFPPPVHISFLPFSWLLTTVERSFSRFRSVSISFSYCLLWPPWPRILAPPLDRESLGPVGLTRLPTSGHFVCPVAPAPPPPPQRDRVSHVSTHDWTVVSLTALPPRVRKAAVSPLVALMYGTCRLFGHPCCTDLNLP